jgi:hypothetical protein
LEYYRSYKTHRVLLVLKDYGSKNSLDWETVEERGLPCFLLLVGSQGLRALAGKSPCSQASACYMKPSMLLEADVDSRRDGRTNTRNAILVFISRTRKLPSKL